MWPNGIRLDCASDSEPQSNLIRCVGEWIKAKRSNSNCNKSANTAVAKPSATCITSWEIINEVKTLAYPFESQHKHCLTFSHMFNEFRQLIRQFPDQRTGQNTVYSIEDVALGAFSVQGFRAINEQLLIALDGTQYHCSSKTHCNSCTGIRLSHRLLLRLIANGSFLEPEFIIPQDGHQKQDGEMAAAQRWLTQYAERYRATEQFFGRSLSL